MNTSDHQLLSDRQAARLILVAHALLAVALVATGLLVISVAHMMSAITSGTHALGFPDVAIPMLLAWVAGACGQLGWTLRYRLQLLDARDRDELRQRLDDMDDARLSAMVRAWDSGTATVRRRELRYVANAHRRAQAIQAEYQRQQQDRALEIGAGGGDNWQRK